MKSDRIIDKIYEDIVKEQRGGDENTHTGYKEEVKNLEKRIKNEIDTKLGEIDKKLGMLAEAAKNTGADSDEEKGDAAENTETLSDEDTESKTE